ncbi:MAG: hypothetical protein M1831_006698 [Alyxoria varia]|nr:MAG: hypothetical protein M1831_006698 [Alyxoria varia]
MTPEEVSRMFAPRKNVQRSNSSSSLQSNSSSTSSASTASASSNNNNNQPNGIQNGENSAGYRKKTKGLWPSSKAEPVSGLSTARPQSVSAATVGPSAASAISALQSPSSLGNSQHMVHPAPQQNAGSYRAQGGSDSTPMLSLLSMNGTFERKSISVPLHPDVQRIGRQTNAKTQPTPANGYFDSKVLSRQHAEVWAERDGKIFIRDVKSSNGTFLNGKRLSSENKDSEPYALKEQDILELGIDIVSEDQKTVVHHKVAARVEHAGLFANAGLEGGYGEFDVSGAGGSLQSGSQAFRNRRQSHGSNASGASRFGPGAPGNPAPYHSKWLQPVTMEQVVKRINTELRQARLQSQDLNHTGNFLDAVLTKSSPIPPPQPQKIVSPSKGSARFPEPPAPPPSQPLPEKPDAVRAKLSELPSLQPLLKRSDTEKPKGADGSSPISPSKGESRQQIITLVEALNTAQKELTSQTERMKTLEENLEQEREARNSAEQKVERLKTEPASTSGWGSEAAPPAKENVQGEEGQRNNVHDGYELMRTEMASMREQLERYRQRAESAEQESQRDRETLAEMVARIRKRDDAVAKRKAAKAAKSTRRTAGMNDTIPASGSTPEDTEDVEDQNSQSGGDSEDNEIDNADEILNGHVDTLLRRSTLKPDKFKDAQSPVAWSPDTLRELSSSQLEELATAVKKAELAMKGQVQDLDLTRSSRSGNVGTDQMQMVHGTAPYASILGVVILGVGLMGWLNGWSKGAAVTDR